MAIDEELLKPTRAHLANLDMRIATAEREMVENIERWGKDDRDYARQQYQDFYRSVDPLRREREAVSKLIADYYGLQPMPPLIIGQPLP